MRQLSRRDFIALSTISVASFMSGCAVNPVSGKSELMLVSEEQEIQIDRKNSPYQFSVDYGISQDTALNIYLKRTGKAIASHTHRPHLPYSFQCVNAVYVNAYAFPGGSIAVTRGILLKLKNEAELGALFGHELGHINARHTARQMSKSTLIQAIGNGISSYAGTYSSSYGQLASQINALGGGALLASYSRDNEREADALGMNYMTKAGYNPKGIVGLMDMLQQTSKHSPSAIELMFSTHPMSSERYTTAQNMITQRYKGQQNLPLFRERYMDNTASLRAQSKTIIATQQGAIELHIKNLNSAQEHFKAALRYSPNDYTAKTMMSKTLLMAGKDLQALSFAEGAKKIYPGEPQAILLSGLINIDIKRFNAALNNFTAYDKVLPNNPLTDFYLGSCRDGMGQRGQAAQHYWAFLQVVNSGQQAQYAQQRLQKWGYIK